MPIAINYILIFYNIVMTAIKSYVYICYCSKYNVFFFLLLLYHGSDQCSVKALTQKQLHYCRKFVAQAYLIHALHLPFYNNTIHNPTLTNGDQIQGDSEKKEK